MSRRCRSCNESFRPDGGWQRVCWPCWRELREQAEQPRTVVVSPVDAALFRQAINLCQPARHEPAPHDLCMRVCIALAKALQGVREDEAA